MQVGFNACCPSTFKVGVFSNLFNFERRCSGGDVGDSSKYRRDYNNRVQVLPFALDKNSLRVVFSVRFVGCGDHFVCHRVSLGTAQVLTRVLTLVIVACSGVRAVMTGSSQEQQTQPETTIQIDTQKIEQPTQPAQPESPPETPLVAPDVIPEVPPDASNGEQPQQPEQPNADAPAQDPQDAPYEPVQVEIPKTDNDHADNADNADNVDNNKQIEQPATPVVTAQNCRVFIFTMDSLATREAERVNSGGPGGEALVRCAIRASCFDLSVH